MHLKLHGKFNLTNLKKSLIYIKKPLKIKQYLFDSGDPAASVNIVALHLSLLMHHTVLSVSKKIYLRWN